MYRAVRGTQTPKRGVETCRPSCPQGGANGTWRIIPGRMQVVSSPCIYKRLDHLEGKQARGLANHGY